MKRERGYKTRQKTAILNYLSENSFRHVTAGDIANHLRDTDNPVGVATVYRYIDTLMNEGILQKYVLDSGKGAVYQYIGDDGCRDHFHLKCEACGQLIHMECRQIQDLYSHIQDGHGFCIDAQKTVFYGACEDCLTDQTETERK